MKRTPSRLPAALQKIAKTKGQACRPEWTFGSREWNESHYKNSGTAGTASVCPRCGLGDSAAQRRVGHRFRRGEKGPGVGKGPLFLGQSEP
ncbi:hypothetical protein ACRRTK_008015 [Alexandromys fortis]